jgi:putative membrane protein
MRTLSLAGWSRSIGFGLCLAIAPLAQAADSNLSSHDQKFVKEAAMGGLYEVQAGQLAAQKATSSEVKQMAQHIVDDHTKANDQLKSLAQAKGVTDLPMQLDSKHQRQLDHLNKLSGAEFDRTYSKMMVSDHKDDIKLFQKEADNGKDADLKQFAASILPKLQQHLSMAESSHTAMEKGSTSGSSSDTSGAGQSGQSSGQSQRPAQQ